MSSNWKSYDVLQEIYNTQQIGVAYSPIKNTGWIKMSLVVNQYAKV